MPDFLEQLERVSRSTFTRKRVEPCLTKPPGCSPHTRPLTIENARRRGEAGGFGIEKPARALFNDFVATLRRVTARHYRLTLRLAVTDPMLKPVGEFFPEG